MITNLTGKGTLCDDKLLYRDTGLFFTLEGEIPSLITDYDFNKTHSPDAEHFYIFLEGLHFDTIAKIKIFKDGNLIKNYYKKRAILASGLKTIFFQRIVLLYVID